MKVTLKAKEIIDADVSTVSLVKHASMRAPFKIVKSEGDVMAQGSNFLSGVRKFFGEEEAEGKVAFVAVRKSLDELISPVLLSSGFSVDGREDHGDVVVYKQEGYVEGAIGSMLYLNEDVAVGLDKIVKSFEPYPSSTDFNENVGSANFYPSVYQATSTLVDTISSIMYEATNKGEAASGVASALSAFSDHVRNLVSLIPESVIKMDFNLQSQLGGSRFTANADLAKTEEGSVNTKGKLKEAVAGDLDGLTIVQKEEAAVVVEPATNAAATEIAAAPVVETSEETVRVREEGAIREYIVKYEIVDGEKIEVSRVAKTDDVVSATVPAVEIAAVAAAPQVDAGIASILAGMESLKTSLTESLGVLTTRIEKAEAGITESKELATKAVQKADTTVVMSAFSMDESLGTLQRKPLSKADVRKDIWQGVMPEFDDVSDVRDR